MRTYGWMPVFYVNDIKGFTAGTVTVVKSWDGSYYAETNLLDACGPRQLVRSFDGVGCIDNHRSNCPISFRDDS